MFTNVSTTTPYASEIPYAAETPSVSTPPGGVGDNTESDPSQGNTDAAINNATPPTTGPSEAGKSNGADQVKKPKEPVEGWNDFTKNVKGGYKKFKKSGFDPRFRGANNDYSYKVSPKVLGHISAQAQGNRGNVNLGPKGQPDYYQVAHSHTGSVSLHKPIPKQHQQGNMKSYVYHLK